MKQSSQDYIMNRLFEYWNCKLFKNAIMNWLYKFVSPLKINTVQLFVGALNQLVILLGCCGSNLQYSIDYWIMNSLMQSWGICFFWFDSIICGNNHYSVVPVTVGWNS